MAYLVTACTLQSMVDDSTPAIATAFNLKTTTGNFAFGEYLRLRITVTSTPANFAVGQRFIFNPCLFFSTQYTASYTLGIGWVIDIDSVAGAGLFATTLNLGNNLANTTQRNAKILVSLSAANVMIIDYYFYAVQDIFGYLSTTMRSNALTLQTAGLGQPLLNNNSANVYNRTLSYLEFILYEANPTTLQPASSFYADPYIRDSAAPSYKQNSYAVAAKFYDNTIGGNIAWAGADLNANSLTLAQNVVNGVFFAKATRIGNPQLSTGIDNNFSIVGDLSRLIINENNEIKFALNTITQAPDKVVVRLFRVDAPALSSTQPFYIEYDIRTADIPAADATPYPNTISGQPLFSTPAEFSLFGSPTSMYFSINGNYLVRDAQYRIWIGLYDSGTQYVSSHITPIMKAVTNTVRGFTIEGNTQTLDYQYPNSNDVTLSQYERFRSLVTLKGGTYTAPAGITDFLNQLVRVTASVDDGNTILATADYDFQAGRSISNPNMMLDVSGTDYTFSFDYRAPSNAATAISNPLNIVHIAIFRVPNSSGGNDVVSYSFRQTIRRYAENTVRVVNLRFLDYAAFLLGAIQPVDTFCEDTPLYIVEAELDAVPVDAKLQAYVMFGTPNVTESVFEEEAAAGLYLPRFTASQISNVSPSFGVDKLAYFTLDISRFPSNAIATSVGVIAVNI